MFKKVLLSLALISFSNVNSVPASWEEARFIIQRLGAEGRVANPDNAMGIFNYVSSSIKSLATDDGFVKISMFIVPFCVLASLFTTPENISRKIESGTSTLSEYVYSISSAIGKVQGAKAFGNSAGRQKMSRRYMRDIGLRRAIN